jgi:O-antigen/teichoic acid export membrane protein
LADEQQSGFGHEDRKKARKGTLLSVIGGAILAGVRALGFFLRAIFGGEMWGLYAIAWALIELLAFLLVGGFADAIVIFSSRQKHDGEQGEEHYRSLATIIFAPFFVSLLLAGGIHIFAEPLYNLLWTEHDPLLIPLVRTLAWALPLLVLVQVPVEATRSTLHFGYAIGIVQIAFPLLSLLCTLGLYFTVTESILAVAQGSILALLLCLPASLYAYGKHFDLGQTLRAALGFRWSREALSFALPQSLNMMLNQGLVRLDSLMLSFFGVSANAIGIYSLVSDLTQLVRLAKMAFSGVFSPLVAKYRAQQNKLGVEEALEDLVQKTSSLGLGLLLIVMSLWPVVIFKPGEAWDDSLLFPWMLAAGPMMSCFFGLCGNALLMYGYSRVLLLNALATGLINLVLNALFIPLWGLFGAALATAIANVSISLLQIVELRRLEGISVKAHFYTRTLLAGAAPLALVFFLSALSWSATGEKWGLENQTARLGLAGLSVSFYALLLWVLPGPRPFGARS